jgi:outer membrane protein insertion porin family
MNLRASFILFIPLYIILSAPKSLRSEEIISAIKFISNVRIDEEELKSLVSLKELEPLRQDVIDKAIHELYATGTFRRIDVFAERTKDGVIISFYLQGRDVVRQINFIGNKFITSKRLRRNIELEVNKLYSEELLKKSVDQIIELYRDQSFFMTKVEPTVRGEGSGSISVDFKIDEGGRKNIDILEFNCETEKVREIFNKKFRYGDIYYDKEEFEESVEAITGMLIDSGYWNIKVSSPEIMYSTQESKLKVRLNIDPGIKYNMTFKGNHAFATDELLKVIDFNPHKSGFSHILLDEWKQKLVAFYQKNGYAMVSVDVEEIEITGDTHTLSFKINEGVPMRIKEIKFEGNRFFDDDKIKSMMLTKEQGIFSGNIDFLYDWMFDYYPKGILIESRLKEDIENIEYQYKEMGFLNAGVNIKSIDYLAESNEIVINILVKEGDRVFVKDVEFEGNFTFTDDELKKVVKIEQRKPFNPWLADEGIKLLKNHYDNNGFIFSKIEIENIFINETNEVLIRYKIDEGPEAHVNKIFITGNEITKGYVLRRELSFSEGEKLTPGGIFESQRKIYRLGFIERASIDIKNVEADGGTDLEVKVKEGKFNRFDFRFGYGTAEGLRSSFEFTRKNLGGRGQTIFARADISYWLRDVNPFSDIFSSEDNYFNTRVFNVGFIWPWLFRQDMDFRVNFINQERRRIYQLKSNDIILAVERDLTRHYHGGVQYQLRFRDPLGSGPSDPRYEDKRRLGFLEFFLLHDTRNNPFEPYKGHLQTYRLDFASRYLAPSGEYDYLKLFVKGDFFTRLIKKVVAAFSIRGGYGYMLGEGDIPIEERFFLGGTTSVRGFEEDSLGPVIYNEDTGEYIPAGGDFMLGYNLELRFSLRKGLGFVVFTDGGNVWKDSSEADFGKITSFRDLRESAGVGFRYATPIGPLRLDLGVKLDKRKDEPLNEWHFFVGNMF